MNESRYHAAVFGATSAIATEILRSIATERSAFLLLIGRDAQKLETLATDLRTRGADCETLALNVLDPDIDWSHHLGSRVWDLFLLAHGSLPDQQATLSNGVSIAREISINFTSHTVIAAACTTILEKQQRGTLAVIGSVAGDRGRQSNYLYGSAKAGIETFMAGLRHHFAANKDIHTVLLKPGMTDTPMTADLPKGPLFSPADKVGRLAWKAIRKGKAVAYLPGWWSLVMLIIRSVPGFVFHKTKL
ncbi:SDR family NAD(P)-dependent oxidoreductase [Haloferula sp.]|uniref:SDR family NAD(P)-dependent oxidoreductase n=1 Tax=Haloferula sp. TaxID=2497595 RepID=UPI00329B6048